MTLKKLSESSSTLQTLHKMSVNIFHLNRCDLVGIIYYNSFHLNMFNLFSNKILRINPYKSCFILKVLDFQVSCSKIYSYRLDENPVFDNIVSIFVN